MTPGVAIVQLDRATLAALGAGDPAAARTAAVPLTPYLTGAECRSLWAVRAVQVAAEPASAAWITGVVWDSQRRVAVGCAGFHGPPDERGMVEVGYRTDPRYRRQGYARAALRAMLDRAAREPAVTTVRACVRSDNLASQALVLDAGFRPVGEQIDEEDGPETVYERPA